MVRRSGEHVSRTRLAPQEDRCAARGCGPCRGAAARTPVAARERCRAQAGPFQLRCPLDSCAVYAHFKALGQPAVASGPHAVTCAACRRVPRAGYVVRRFEFHAPVWAGLRRPCPPRAFLPTAAPRRTPSALPTPPLRPLRPHPPPAAPRQPPRSLPRKQLSLSVCARARELGCRARAPQRRWTGSGCGRLRQRRVFRGGVRPRRGGCW